MDEPYAFDSEASIDRTYDAVRYVEQLRRSPGLRPLPPTPSGTTVAVVRITGVRDARFWTGILIDRNVESLPIAYTDGDPCLVCVLTGTYLTVGQRLQGLVVGEYDSRAVVLVSGDDYVWVKITEQPSADPGPYVGVRGYLDVDSTWKDVSPEVEITGIYRATNVPVGEKIAVGQYIQLRPSATYPTKWETYHPPVVRGIVRGKLDGSMSKGGSATVSVWSGGVDTGENITAYDWLLSTGKTIAAGCTVIIGFDESQGAWYVIDAQCTPDEE